MRASSCWCKTSRSNERPGRSLEPVGATAETRPAVARAITDRAPIQFGSGGQFRLRRMVSQAGWDAGMWGRSFGATRSRDAPASCLAADRPVRQCTGVRRNATHPWTWPFGPASSGSCRRAGIAGASSEAAVGRRLVWQQEERALCTAFASARRSTPTLDVTPIFRRRLELE